MLSNFDLASSRFAQCWIVLLSVTEVQGRVQAYSTGVLGTPTHVGEVQHPHTGTIWIVQFENKMAFIS